MFSMLKDQSKQNPFIAQSVKDYLRMTFLDPVVLSEIINSFTQAPNQYFLRVNLTKTTLCNVLNELQEKYPNHHILEGPLPNSLSISIEGPNELKKYSIHIYCDKFAAESVMLGANLFIPGICEISGKFQENECVSVSLLPQKAPKFLEGSKEAFLVGNGITKIRSKDFPHLTNGIAIETTLSRYSIPQYRENRLFKEGFISDQHFQANLATKIFADFIVANYLANHEFPSIFDLCSAPGHKTCAISEWCYYLSGIDSTPQWFPIISIDRSKNRLLHLKTDIERLNLSNIQIIACKLEKLIKNYPKFHSSGDFVFFDPPCSALGPRPKLFIDKSIKDLEDYARNQRRLLKIVNEIVKPGGYLMYNTCTLPIQENEEIVGYAVEKLGYSVVSIPEIYQNLASPGLSFPSLSEKDLQNLLRFYPNRPEGQGYFVALLQKQIDL